MSPTLSPSLSYYITDTATYFTSNATFIFMEGEHLLDGKDSVQVVINNVDNLTLRGESGHSNTDSIIRCSNNTHGLLFISGHVINIEGISISRCGLQNTSPLSFINITSLHIHRTTSYNNIVYGTGTRGIVNIICATYTKITITNSTFTNNIVGGNGGGLVIYPGSNTHNDISISNSAFVNNTVTCNGGGLVVTGFHTDIHNNITINTSSFTNNTVGW